MASDLTKNEKSKALSKAGVGKYYHNLSIASHFKDYTHFDSVAEWFENVQANMAEGKGVTLIGDDLITFHVFNMMARSMVLRMVDTEVVDLTFIIRLIKSKEWAELDELMTTHALFITSFTFPEQDDTFMTNYEMRKIDTLMIKRVTGNLATFTLVSGQVRDSKWSKILKQILAEKNTIIGIKGK